MKIIAKIRELSVIPVVAVTGVLSATVLHAAQETPGAVNWKFMIIGLFGGLALFLYGMGKMSDGMKRSAGNRMRSILAALTKNRFIALTVGAFVTMVIQSSSATTVMLVSFVQAGLMTFTQSLGVILGADIGTTVTAQLIAFKLTDYALLMVAIGFGLQMVSKKTNVKNIGEVILGFGILFFGMKLMSDAMEPLRTHADFMNMMKGLENPLMGLFAGTVFTAVVQSSSASTGVVIVLAQQGLITLPAGIAVIFGANIGTCVTAGLASIGAAREAKRVALAHVLFKVAGVLMFIFWIPEFAEIIKTISQRFGSQTARQIANAHTIFNVSLGLFFLPFTGIFGKVILKILPDKKIDPGIKPATWHLDDGSIQTPAIALGLARAEISRVAKLLNRMMQAVIIPFMSDENLIKKENLPPEEKELLIREIPKRDAYFPELTLLEGIDMREQKIDFLNEKIHDYLISVAREGLDSVQADEIYGMISISNDLEFIGDIIHRNMLPLIAKKKELSVDFSGEGKEELLIYHQKVCRQLKLLEEALVEMDIEKARRIMSEERKYLDLEAQYRLSHLERVRHNRKESAETHEVHMELMDLLKQIMVYSSNIASIYLVKCRTE
jgi:phosphate:Na+ symporter